CARSASPRALRRGGKAGRRRRARRHPRRCRSRAGGRRRTPATSCGATRTARTDTPPPPRAAPTAAQARRTAPAPRPTRSGQLPPDRLRDLRAQLLLVLGAVENHHAEPVRLLEVELALAPELVEVPLVLLAAERDLG